MKIIEAMRRIKSNLEKVDTLCQGLAQFCADYDVQTPVYEDQAGQVRAWLTAVHDLLEETERLKYRISKTNLATQVVVELDGHTISKSITEWIARRDHMVKKELASWEALSDRNLRKDQIIKTPEGDTKLIQIRRYFDPKQRDEKCAAFRAEPHTIDGALEVANAVTDLLE